MCTPIVCRNPSSIEHTMDRDIQCDGKIQCDDRADIVKFLDAVNNNSGLGHELEYKQPDSPNEITNPLVRPGSKSFKKNINQKLSFLCKEKPQANSYDFKYITLKDEINREAWEQNWQKGFDALAKVFRFVLSFCSKDP